MDYPTVYEDLIRIDAIDRCKLHRFLGRDGYFDHPDRYASEM